MQIVKETLDIIDRGKVTEESRSVMAQKMMANILRISHMRTLRLGILKIDIHM